MKKLIRKQNYWSIIQVIVLLLSMNPRCLAAFVEFTDEAAFRNETGDPQYFIDFESYGDGTPVIGSPDINGDEWLNWGIQFTAMERGDSLILFDPPEKPEYTHTLLAAYATDVTSYLITFSEPVASFGLYIVDSETTSANEKIILRDVDGNSEDFVMPVGGSVEKFFRGYSSDIPIAKVQIIEDLDGEGLLLDNVMYSVLDDPKDFYEPKIVRDVDLLPNDRILVTDGGTTGNSDSCVYEIDRDGQIFWSYTGLNWAHNADKHDNLVIISDTGNNRIVIVDESGTIVWNTDELTLSDGSTLSYPNDANLLGNGNRLITDRDNHRVIEIDENGNVIWQYGETGVPGRGRGRLNEPYNADQLANGNRIICDSENNRIIEVYRSRSIVWTYAVALNWPRDADRLTNGNMLITDTMNNRIIEVTLAGKIVWSYTTAPMSYDADRLRNGNTLISADTSILEVDASGAVVWSYPPVTY
ncbi:PQQ-binding-like beta-propeller repeat protein [Planctomycetota bacterium]